MAQINVVGTSGSRTIDLDLPEVNVGILHDVVTWQLAKRRAGTASTKTRSQVSRTGKKMYSQKGTGNARHGNRAAPIFVGGGVAFGPKPRGYTVKVNRKERRRALRAALSVHAARDSLAALDAGAFSGPSTKQAAEALGGFGEGGRVLVVLTDGEEAAALSFRNIPNVQVLRAGDVGVADVIGAGHLAASPAALEQLATIAAAPQGRAAEGASA